VNGDAGLPPVAPVAVAIAANPLERTMAVIAALILAVIALSVGLAIGLGAGA
jgi:hypothetical protein